MVSNDEDAKEKSFIFLYLQNFLLCDSSATKTQDTNGTQQITNRLQHWSLIQKKKLHGGEQSPLLKKFFLPSAVQT